MLGFWVLGAGGVLGFWVLGAGGFWVLGVGCWKKKVGYGYNFLFSGLRNMGDYRKLRVWKDSRELVILIFTITEKGRISKEFSFRDQMRRCSLSVISNIAEGEEAGSDKLCIRYFNISKGSLAELSTQLEVAEAVNYISHDDFIELSTRVDSIAKQLKSLIRYRLNNP